MGISLDYLVNHWTTLRNCLLVQCININAIYYRFSHVNIDLTLLLIKMPKDDALNFKDNKGNFKIFAFFGSDLNEYPDYFLNNLYQDGFFILALDPKAIEIASKLNIIYTNIFEWIDSPEMIKTIDIAWDCETKWFNAKKDLFSINGICWPEVDHQAMHWFWLDAILSYKLVEVLKKFEIVEFLIIDNDSTIPIVYHWSGSVCKKIWRHELSNVIKILNSNKKLQPHYNSIPEQFYTKYHRYLYSAPECLTDKIAFCASETELNRSNVLLEDLISSFPNRVVIIPYLISESLIAQYFNKVKIPFIMPPENLFNYSKERDIFIDGYQELLKISKEKEWEKCLCYFQYHFMHYCTDRWPKLNLFFSYYFELFSKFTPSLVICSTLELIEPHLLMIAARKKNIQSISIPHSYIGNSVNFGLKSDLIHQFTYHCHMNKISKLVMQKNCTINDEKFIPCRDCTDINPYTGRMVEIFSPKEKINVLVLLNPTKSETNINSELLFSFINSKKQLEAIKFLANLPDYLEENVSIIFKVHMGFPERELLNSLGEDIKKKILPNDSDLKTVLIDTDLVVGVNYLGSAMIHTIISEKPFVNFINDEFFFTSNTKFNAFFSYCEKYINQFNSEAALCEYLCDVIKNPSLLKEYTKNLMEFSSEFLHGGDYPSLSESIQKWLK